MRVTWSDHRKFVASAIAPKITGGLSIMVRKKKANVYSEFSFFSLYYTAAN